MAEGEIPEIEKVDKALFERCLADFHSVKLYVRKHPGVRGIPEAVLPKRWHEGEAAVCLEYGLDLRNPIAGWKITAEGVGAILSFARTPSETFVPWEAVVAVTCEGLKPKPRERPKFKLV